MLNQLAVRESPVAEAGDAVAEAVALLVENSIVEGGEQRLGPDTVKHPVKVRWYGCPTYHRDDEV